jgi:hypothetical protein
LNKVANIPESKAMAAPPPAYQATSDASTSSTKSNVEMPTWKPSFCDDCKQPIVFKKPLPPGKLTEKQGGKQCITHNTNMALFSKRFFNLHGVFWHSRSG